MNNKDNLNCSLNKIDSNQMNENVLIDDKLCYEDDKDKNLMGSLVNLISKSFDLIRSVLIRVVFGIHLFIAICLVCFVRNELWYFVNTVGIVFIVIEWFAIAMKNDGKDLQWFSPSFFLYIATIIPPTWFLELENIRQKMIALETLEGKNVLGTNGSYENSQSFNSDILRREQTQLGIVTNNTPFYEFYDEALPIILPSDIKAALAGAHHNFAMYIEVSMMLIIIIGRWIMPKKGITRSELSQLLLVYMSLASDIIDLLSILQEQKVMVSEPMVYTTLSIYSWSLFQFTLNLVVKRGRNGGSITSLNNSSKSGNEIGTNNSLTNKKRENYSNYIHNELWNVAITLFMQDFPFFILRTVCVFKFNIVSYLFLFFTFKNGILFSLQIYRIIAICTDRDFNFDPLAKFYGGSMQQTLTNIGGFMIPKDINKISKQIFEKSETNAKITDENNSLNDSIVGIVESNEETKQNNLNLNNNKTFDYYECA